MSNPKETVVAAIVTAGVAVMATELLRRLTSDSTPGQKPLASIPVSKFGRQLLREEFDLRPGYAFCNGGSYGHVPRRIIQEQVKYIKQRERDADAWYRFSEGEKSKYFEAVRQVSEFVGADKNNVVLVENANFVKFPPPGISTALRSVRFVAGDKVLVNSHTHPTVLNTVKQLAEDIPGLEIVKFDRKIPINTESDIVNPFETAIKENPGTKVLIVDHISSASAILTPLKPILDICRKEGIISIVDGAHAPGQIPLNLEDLQADYYVGNLHKWMLAPRGSALLYVNPKHHDRTRPLIGSHNNFKKTLADRFLPSATRDSISYLVLPEVIKFHKALGGLDVFTERNRALVSVALKILAEGWGTDIYPVSEEFRAPFMGLVALPKAFQDNFAPDEPDCYKLMKALSNKGASVSFMATSGMIWVRISVHVWNCLEDFYVVRDVVLEMMNDIPSIAQIKV